MRKLLLFVLLLGTLPVVADERGQSRLERISRYYSAMGSYSLSFVLRAGGAEQRGELMVAGNNSYMRIADTEIYIMDSLRYEVRRSAKEIVVDRADAYERELLNPLNGFSNVAAEYNIEERTIDGRMVIQLTPKRSGELISIVTAVDGESITKVRYGVGQNLMELEVEHCEKRTNSLPKFIKEEYKGFELIDFR